ncbi:MAG TPA: ATP-binding protein [Homoserinimonas sp.]|nr:ATP-binding protein [Homoserinimonas sp.]
MRLHVPPRDFASLVILRAITRAGWMVAAVLLLATAVVVVDVLVHRGLGPASVPPVGFLAAQLAALALMFLRPRPRTGIIYIAVSVVSIAGFQLALLTTDPSLGDTSQFLLNRPIVALCAIGAITARPIGGIQWTTAALLAGELTSVAVQFALGRSVELGIGPLLAYLLIVLLMLWLLRSGANQAGLLPDERSINEETRRLEEERDAEARAAAIVHDTVLSDLAAIVHGRVVLTEYDRQHLRDNIQRLNSAMAGALEPTPSGRVDLDLLGVVSDLRWRGLSVEISGAGSALSLLDASTRTAALNAVKAALENVLVHAGTASADLFIDDNPDEVMIMVVDQGCGFEADAVGGDRLGLRLSIVKRIEDCGGRATLWSKPGVGTSVLLSLPKPVGGHRGI